MTLMKAGAGFTHLGRRYEPGDRFDLLLVPAFQRASYVRLYGLTPWRPKKKDTE